MRIYETRLPAKWNCLTKQIYRYVMNKTALLVSIWFSVSCVLFSQNVTSHAPVRPVNQSTLVGVGKAFLYDTYLSPLRYEGITFSLMHDRIQGPIPVVTYSCNSSFRLRWLLPRILPRLLPNIMVILITGLTDSTRWLGRVDSAYLAAGDGKPPWEASTMYATPITRDRLKHQQISTSLPWLCTTGVISLSDGN